MPGGSGRVEGLPEAGEAARAQEEEEAAGARPWARAALCGSDTRKRYCLCSCAQLLVLCRGAARLHHNLRVGKMASALERAPWSELALGPPVWVSSSATETPRVCEAAVQF